MAGLDLDHHGGARVPEQWSRMNRRLHLWITRSALAATLALVLVPTLGRLIGLPAAPVHHAALQATTPGTGEGSHAADPGSTIPPRLDMDCSYCALLLGAASLPVPRLASGAPPRGIATAVPQTGTPRLDRHPTGLGSRGPPLTG